MEMLMERLLDIEDKPVVLHLMGGADRAGSDHGAGEGGTGFIVTESLGGENMVYRV